MHFIVAIFVFTVAFNVPAMFERETVQVEAAAEGGEAVLIVAPTRLR